MRSLCSADCSSCDEDSRCVVTPTSPLQLQPFACDTCPEDHSLDGIICRRITNKVCGVYVLFSYSTAPPPPPPSFSLLLYTNAHSLSLPPSLPLPLPHPLSQSCSTGGLDIDRDGITDAYDSCPYVFNPSQYLSHCAPPVGWCPVGHSSHGVLWSSVPENTTATAPCAPPYIGIHIHLTVQQMYFSYTCFLHILWVFFSTRTENMFPVNKCIYFQFLLSL